MLIDIHSFIHLPRVYKSNNSEQTVGLGQDGKATRDALITAHSN